MWGIVPISAPLNEKLGSKLGMMIFLFLFSILWRSVLFFFTSEFENSVVESKEPAKIVKHTRHNCSWRYGSHYSVCHVLVQRHLFFSHFSILASKHTLLGERGGGDELMETKSDSAIKLSLT